MKIEFYVEFERIGIVKFKLNLLTLKRRREMKC
jgi:hypothetical protein